MSRFFVSGLRPPSTTTFKMLFNMTSGSCHVSCMHIQIISLDEKAGKTAVQSRRYGDPSDHPCFPLWCNFWARTSENINFAGAHLYKYVAEERAPKVHGQIASQYFHFLFPLFRRVCFPHTSNPRLDEKSLLSNSYGEWQQAKYQVSSAPVGFASSISSRQPLC